MSKPGRRAKTIHLQTGDDSTLWINRSVGMGLLAAMSELAEAILSESLVETPEPPCDSRPLPDVEQDKPMVKQSPSDVGRSV